MTREAERGAQGRGRSLRSGVDRGDDRRHQVLQPAVFLVRQLRAAPILRGTVDQRHRDAARAGSFFTPEAFFRP